MSDNKPFSLRELLIQILSVVLVVYVLICIAFPNLPPQQEYSKLALFAMLGLCLVFLGRPIHKRWAGAGWTLPVDLVVCLLTVGCFGYLIVHSEELFKAFWVVVGDKGAAINARSGSENSFEIGLGILGLILVLEAARRALGWTLPILAGLFIVYGLLGHKYPDFLFPHAPKGLDDVVAKTFLQNGGAIGIALKVMFKYVFLFVVFGSLLEATGATEFIIRFARRIFRNSVGGPAKVSVVSSGLMGSLSGSAVANTATTGTFTIPLMRSTGFDAETAGGVEAAASSGGALMPPIMGAGAYMMLEMIEGVKYVEILQAAIIPALLYYLAILLMVHWQARKAGATTDQAKAEDLKLEPVCGALFFGAFVVLVLLLMPPLFKLGTMALPPGFTADKAAAICVVGVALLAALHPRTRLGFKALLNVCVQACRSGVLLVAAAACVGIILGIVGLTGLGTDLPIEILKLSQGALLLGLVLLMIATLILGMGLPSVVCYLLMAEIVAEMIVDLGTVDIAMHLFIFYFSMMSMVTPPVALAAFAAGAISGGNLMLTAVKAFGFALVGFALPYAFVLKPELIMLSPDGTGAGIVTIMLHVLGALAAIVALAAGIVGYIHRPIPFLMRLVLVAAALVSFLTMTSGIELWIHLGAIGLGLGLVLFLMKQKPLPAAG